MALNESNQTPDGLRYIPDMLSVAEERDLIDQVQALQFSEVRMHGVVAKRRVAHFGWVYGYETWRITPGPPIPDFLVSLRGRIAELVQTDPYEFAEALVTEYPPGAGIGWHRDAPMFGPLVIGVSLLGSCRFRFQRGTGPERKTMSLTLEPRSAYVLSGLARFQWQHSIPATPSLRYSITFRTIAAGRKKTAAGTPDSHHGRNRKTADGEALQPQSDARSATSAYRPAER